MLLLQKMLELQLLMERILLLLHYMDIQKLDAFDKLEIKDAPDYILLKGYCRCSERELIQR